MSRRSSGSRVRPTHAILAGVVATLVVGGAAAACDPTATSVGPGGECFVATDCQPGLVCLEQPNKTRICSSDLSRVAGQTPPDGGNAADDGGEGGMTDGPISPADATTDRTLVQDTGVKDTGGGADTGSE